MRFEFSGLQRIAHFLCVALECAFRCGPVVTASLRSNDKIYFPIKAAPPMANRRFISSSLFAAILVLFFMSFVNVSCGPIAIELTGTQLAIGGSISVPDMESGRTKQQRVTPEPLATGALIAAGLGLLVSLAANGARILAGLAGVAGGVLLLLLKFKIVADIAESTHSSRDGPPIGEIVQINFGFGFWGALTLFAVAALFNFTRGTEKDVQPVSSGPPQKT